MTSHLRFLVVVTAAIAASCATAPKPTAESFKVRANPPAHVEGRVTDPSGRPVAGIAVRGIPWSKDVPWSAAALTACDGSFRLALPAPGIYGFLLFWQGTAVITPSPGDPARVEIRLEPGQERRGVDLVFLDSERRQVRAPATGHEPSCP